MVRRQKMPSQTSPTARPNSNFRPNFEPTITTTMKITPETAIKSIRIKKGKMLDLLIAI